MQTDSKSRNTTYGGGAGVGGGAGAGIELHFSHVRRNKIRKKYFKFIL